MEGGYLRSLRVYILRILKVRSTQTGPLTMTHFRGGYQLWHFRARDSLFFCPLLLAWYGVPRKVVTCRWSIFWWNRNLVDLCFANDLQVCHWKLRESATNYKPDVWRKACEEKWFACVGRLSWHSDIRADRYWLLNPAATCARIAKDRFRPHWLLLA